MMLNSMYDNELNAHSSGRPVMLDIGLKSYPGPQ